MTWTIKQRPHLAGAPMLADYECPEHGVFEAQVQRDENGDPPAMANCLLTESFVRMNDGTGWHPVPCGRRSPWRISAPSLKRDSIPCFAAVRGGDSERRPGMLDTRPLAEGMPVKEWKAKQADATRERRYHQLIAKGLKTKRVQV